MNNQIKLKEARDNYGAKTSELRALLESGKPMTEIREAMTALEGEVAAAQEEVTRYERAVQLEKEAAAVSGGAISAGAGEQRENQCLLSDHSLPRLIERFDFAADNEDQWPIHR